MFVQIISASISDNQQLTDLNPYARIIKLSNGKLPEIISRTPTKFKNNNPYWNFKSQDFTATSEDTIEIQLWNEQYWGNELHWQY